MLMLTTVVTMADNGINNFLIKKWKEFQYGIPLNHVMDGVRGDIYRPNFFLRSELSFRTPKDWREALNRGLIHHCKPVNGKWYDYITNKHYDSLKEWANNCNATFDDILFGVNRIYKNHKSTYIHINHLLDKLGYSDTFTSIFLSLEVDKKDLVDDPLCLAKRPDGSISVSKVRDKKFDSLDPGSSSDIVICVPMDNDGNIVEYSRRSSLPDGMTIYLRNTCGAFYSLEDLLD
jgi:hypothetical protein